MKEGFEPPTKGKRTVDNSTMVINKRGNESYWEVPEREPRADPFETAILSTCRRIYNKVVSILYEENCSINTCHGLGAWNNCLDVVAEFPPTKLDMIRNLHFDNTYVRDERLVAQTLQYFSTADCALKRLVLG